MKSNIEAEKGLKVLAQLLPSWSITIKPFPIEIMFSFIFFLIIFLTVMLRQLSIFLWEGKELLPFPYNTLPGQGLCKPKNELLTTHHVSYGQWLLVEMNLVKQAAILAAYSSKFKNHLSPPASV